MLLEAEEGVARVLHYHMQVALLRVDVVEADDISMRQLQVHFYLGGQFGGDRLLIDGFLGVDGPRALLGHEVHEGEGPHADGPDPVEEQGLAGWLQLLLALEGAFEYILVFVGVAGHPS